MKIIFLDIDGVICNREQWRTRIKVDGEILCHFDPKAVGLLNELTDGTGAKFVLSSTWRMHPIETLKKHFKNEFVSGEIIGVTPRHSGLNVWRGNEIQDWLDKNKELNVESFVILDDDIDMEHLRPRLVHTMTHDETTGEWVEGLTEKHVAKALDLLNTPVV